MQNILIDLPEEAKNFYLAAENAVSVLSSLVRYFKLEGLRLTVLASCLIKLKKAGKWTQKQLLLLFSKTRIYFSILFLFPLWKCRHRKNCHYVLFGTNFGKSSLT